MFKYLLSIPGAHLLTSDCKAATRDSSKVSNFVIYTSCSECLEQN